MKQNKTLYKLVAFLAKPFAKIIFPYKVIGRENVDNIEGGYILCSNHLSNMDPVFFVISHPGFICFMAKSELFANSFLNWFFSSLGAFSVKRGKGDRGALNLATQVLSSKKVLGIFIEGTRSKNGEFLRPKSGAALLSYTTQTPVIPVCITGGATDGKVKAFKRTTIKYGPAIFPAQLGITEGDRKEIKFATNLIMGKIKELRN